MKLLVQPKPDGALSVPQSRTVLGKQELSSSYKITIGMGRKEGAGVPLSPIAGNPSNTKWPGPSSTSVPSGVLIHPAVWPQ